MIQLTGYSRWIGHQRPSNRLARTPLKLFSNDDEMGDQSRSGAGRPMVTHRVPDCRRGGTGGRGLPHGIAGETLHRRARVRAAWILHLHAVQPLLLILGLSTLPPTSGFIHRWPGRWTVADAAEAPPDIHRKLSVVGRRGCE